MNLYNIFTTNKECNVLTLSRKTPQSERRPVCSQQQHAVICLYGASSSVCRDKQIPALSAITSLHARLKCRRHSTFQQTSIPKPDIDQKSRFFSKVRGPLWNIVMPLGTEKLEWCGYLTVKR